MKARLRLSTVWFPAANRTYMTYWTYVTFTSSQDQKNKVRLEAYAPNRTGYMRGGHLGRHAVDWSPTLGSTGLIGDPGAASGSATACPVNPCVDNSCDR